MSNTEYNIVGDTKDYKGCLILTCGKSKERANEVLRRLVTNPTENEKMMIKGYANLRIEKIDGGKLRGVIERRNKLWERIKKLNFFHAISAVAGVQ